MKQNTQRKTPAFKKSTGNTLIGLFIGMVLGVLLSAGVAWYLNKAPIPFLDKVQPAVAPNSSSQALPGKPGDPVPVTSPPAQEGSTQGAVNAPPSQQAPVTVAVATPPPSQPDQKKGQYLQAGSFSQPQDADKLKANLAMMGLESNVQQVMLQDKTYYRLRLGPYNKPEDANRVREKLARAGIESVLIGKE